MGGLSQLLISILGIIFIGTPSHYSIQLVQKAVQFTPILKISTKWFSASIRTNCAIKADLSVPRCGEQCAEDREKVIRDWIKKKSRRLSAFSF